MSRSWVQDRLWWLSLVLLAVFHGGAYANLLPPWGLNDEEQHIHYVQYLTEHGTAPTVGEVYLSPEVVEGLFAAHRRETFHWVAYPSRDPREMGLEGYSYEGYQPPLFYILFAPLYLVVPGDILLKLYVMRWGAVGLSLVTVWMVHRWVVELFPERREVAYLTALMLVLIPEHASAVGKVNNDVLLESVAVAFIWAYTRAMLHGLSDRRSVVLGVLLGLGVLVKMAMGLLMVLLPFLFWESRRTEHLERYVLLICGFAGVLMAPLLFRNLVLYGDLVGFAGFEQLNDVFQVIKPPDVTVMSVVGAVRDLFCHFWVIWWKGAVAARTPVVGVICGFLAVLIGVALVGAAGEWRKDGRLRVVIFSYVVCVVVYAVAVLVSYFEGRVPVIQGRLFLPVYGLVVLLFVWGMSSDPRKVWMVLVTGGLLVLLGVLSLFGNLLPYFYYWSAFVDNGRLLPYVSPGLAKGIGVFLMRFVDDKPPVIRVMSPVVVVGYGMSLALAGVVLFHRVRGNLRSRMV